MGQTLEKPALSKDTHTGSNEYLTYGLSGMQGYRLTMEDAHNHISKVEVTSSLQKKIGDETQLSFFGVYDGHSGSEAAQYLSTNLLANLLRDGEQGDIFSDDTIKKTWLETDIQLEKWTIQEGTYPGTTCVTALLKRNKDKVDLIVPNVGDSRSVLCLLGRCEPMSYDHKPTNDAEKRRIIASGGFVDFGRVNGTLAVSRAFGDFSYKDNKSKPQEEQAVSCVPEIKRVVIDLNQVKESPEPSFLILACDGIWDVMKNEEACQWVKNKLIDQKKTGDVNLGKLCEEMLDHCVLDLESKDNVSVCVVLFNK